MIMGVGIRRDAGTWLRGMVRDVVMGHGWGVGMGRGWGVVKGNG